MSRALLVIDVQNEYFTGALPITYPAGHLEQILVAAGSKSSFPDMLLYRPVLEGNHCEGILKEIPLGLTKWIPMRIPSSVGRFSD